MHSITNDGALLHWRSLGRLRLCCGCRRVLVCVHMVWVLVSRLLLLLVRVLRLLWLLLLPATVLVCLRVFTVCWLLLRVVGGACSRDLLCVLRIPLCFMQENTRTRSTLKCEHIHANKTKSTSARQG